MEKIGSLKSGEIVVNRYNSHLHEDARALLLEALAKIESKGKLFFIEEVDFNRPIGETICISTGPTDQIVYAKRPKRRGFSRFVKNRQPESCSSLVVILKKAENNSYVLITAFIGHRSQPEPWDRRNFNQQTDPQQAEIDSRDFWAKHALVWGCEPIIPGTETSWCPW